MPARRAAFVSGLTSINRERIPWPSPRSPPRDVSLPRPGIAVTARRKVFGGLSDVDRLRKHLRSSLHRALKGGEPAAVAASRSALSAIDNAGAVEPAPAQKHASGPIARSVLGVGAAEVPRRELTYDEVVDILRAEINERERAAAEYARLGRADQAARLRAEVAALVAEI